MVTNLQLASFKMLPIVRHVLKYFYKVLNPNVRHTFQVFFSVNLLKFQINTKIMPEVKNFKGIETLKLNVIVWQSDESQKLLRSVKRQMYGI